MISVNANYGDEEILEKAQEEGLDLGEAEDLQDFVDETGLDLDEAYELWEEVR